MKRPAALYAASLHLAWRLQTSKSASVAQRAASVFPTTTARRDAALDQPSECAIHPDPRDLVLLCAMSSARRGWQSRGGAGLWRIFGLRGYDWSFLRTRQGTSGLVRCVGASPDMQLPEWLYPLNACADGVWPRQSIRFPGDLAAVALALRSRALSKPATVQRLLNLMACDLNERLNRVETANVSIRALRSTYVDCKYMISLRRNKCVRDCSPTTF